MASLTKRTVENIAPGRRDVFVWDAELPGFGVRVTPRGARSYVLQYRNLSGRSRRLTIGRHGVFTVDEARRLARGLLGQVAMGLDPVSERKREAERQRKAAAEDSRRSLTVSALCGLYIAQHAKPYRRTWGDDEARIRRAVAPRFGTRPACDLVRADVVAFHQWVGETRGRSAANRVTKLLAAVYAWGEREGVLPLGHPNPARGVARFREVPRDRFLSPTEVAAVARGIEQEPSATVRGYFWLSLFLGTRKRELLAARWEHVDAERWTLALPVTKSGRPHELPLSRPAREALASLPRVAGNAYVFAGATAGQPCSVSVIDFAWRRIRDRAKLPGVRLHDVRRTLGSWVVQQSGSLALVGSLLNHSDPRTTAAHYARFADAGRRSALETHAQAVLAAATSGESPTPAPSAAVLH
jgi:integrase